MRDIFIGREEEINILRKRVDSFLQGYRQNIAILGKTNIGKSYLIEYFLKTYKPRNLQSIYINLEYINYSSFNINILYLILTGYLKKETNAVNLQEKLKIVESLLPEINKYLPETAKKINDFLAKKERINFDILTAIINAFIKDTGVYLLWILNDYTKLADFSKKMLSQLSKYIMGQKNIMYIFISSNERRAEKMLSEELNLLFGNFEKIYLKGFSAVEAQKFIKIKLGRIDSVAERFLINISGLNPFYLDLLTSCFKQNQPGANIDYLSFLRTLNLCLSDKASPVYNVLQAKLMRLKEKFKDVYEVNKYLISIAEGKKCKNEIGNSLEIESKNVARILNKLIEEETIKRNGDVYFFADNLFAFWVSIVLKARMFCPYCSEDEIKDITFNYLEKKFVIFKEESAKSNIDKILKLVRLFGDENIKINNKKVLLPTIKRLRVVDSYHKTMKFIIGEGKKYLIISFKDTAPREEDIQEFINRCRYFKGRKLRKIFLSLESVDENCRLLAKINKVSLWERDEINFLMKIYNQPPII